jgi:D-alanyl-D-alanine dipeptidase
MTAKIQPETLVPMDLFAGHFPLRIDMAYARPDNLLLGEAIYRKNSRLWLHMDLAKIVLHAAQLCKSAGGFHLVLYDGLRTVEAQQKMMETQRVKENPHWLTPPRLLSPPGTGAHPRGMAIDLGLETAEGEIVDMGTPFDFLATDPGPQKNPAHRNYAGHPQEIMRNRKILDDAMARAAELAGLKLTPLPQEWWDFRFPADFYERYAPISDADLPPQMQMTEISHARIPDFPESHFTAMKTALGI